MKQYQIDRIKDLMDAKGVTLKDLAAQCHISEMTVRRILTAKHNPTTDTVEKIAEALGVHEHYIYEPEGETQSKVPINGYIEYGDTILKIKTFKQLEKAYNDIKHDLDTPKLAKSLIAQDKANQKTQSKQPIDIKTIDLFKREQYDTSKLFTWSFRKSDDEKEDMLNDLGNMCQGYPFKVCGERFLNSECAYISGMFSQNTPKAVEIQKELQKCDNGYGAKKEIRRKYEKVGFARDDWNSYNVHWMLFICWCKVTQNKEFAEKLRMIPPYAMIVENSTFQKAQNGNDTAAFWGMRNKAIKEAVPIIETAAEVEGFTAKKKDMDKAKMEARNSVNHIGTWEGVNCMGKILTICKHCLEDGTQPPIDYDLLRSKQIYLFGKLLTFESVPMPPASMKPNKKVTKETKMNESSTEKIDIPKMVMPDITVNGYDLYCMFTFHDSFDFDHKTHWCYSRSQFCYDKYTQKSGFLFVAAKKGYKDIEHLFGGVKKRWSVMYDEYATSLFSLTTFINPTTKKVDVYSVTFRRNNTAIQYSGGYQEVFPEMIAKTKELLGGFDFAQYCVEKTEERLKNSHSTGTQVPTKKTLPMPRKARVKVTVDNKSQKDI